MANEITMIDDWGQRFGISELSDDQRLQKMDDSSFEDLVWLIKYLKKPIKKVEDELKRRLDENGQRFKHVSYGESTRQTIEVDNEANKKAFVKKYGWGAVQVKSPAQLKKLYGEMVNEDLDRISTYETQKRVKYD